ncbi:hypothetical protein [Pandoraea sp. NPDC087047]|uniref:hypothetical protein n=1 Tax=Pandoraea sp. NPDC087047 TaxID=3364390 RepID=UPI0037F637A7
MVFGGSSARTLQANIPAATTIAAPSHRSRHPERHPATLLFARSRLLLRVVGLLLRFYQVLRQRHIGGRFGPSGVQLERDAIGFDPAPGELPI